MELEGKKIIRIRQLTKKELKAEGWEGMGSVQALVLDDGTILYPSQDEEGNAPGALFGVAKDGETFMV